MSHPSSSRNTLGAGSQRYGASSSHPPLRRATKRRRSYTRATEESDRASSRPSSPTSDNASPVPRRRPRRQPRPLTPEPAMLGQSISDQHPRPPAARASTPSDHDSLFSEPEAEPPVRTSDLIRFGWKSAESAPRKPTGETSKPSTVLVYRNGKLRSHRPALKTAVPTPKTVDPAPAAPPAEDCDELAPYESEPEETPDDDTAGLSLVPEGSSSLKFGRASGPLAHAKPTMWKKPKQIPALQHHDLESHGLPSYTPPTAASNTRTILQPAFFVSFPSFSGPNSQITEPLSFEVVLNQVGYHLAHVLQGCNGVEMGNLYALSQLTTLVSPVSMGSKGSACVKSNAPSRTEPHSSQEKLLKSFSEYLRREKKFYLANRTSASRWGSADTDTFAFLSSKSKDACRSLDVHPALVGLSEALVIVHVHGRVQHFENKE
ncbi:hypothetical protein BOTBODRAFT_60230 [Botryobasidium botryosum FD-172 SS1]|uniref:Uncharacterized protein n=1 Tax=Botryobasidium botryosum (strain FD-172 SS1) TaxID=930990 RepID=A0A067LUP1_BOTB1|nr:hypothetical protein BOTBODRAFT_60230 [Botryobasidium botryosum FD-172 SS1]